MADTPSIKVTKSLSWRGNAKLFTNRYHILGGAPASDAAWHTLFDNVVTAEKAIYPVAVTITKVEGYLADSNLPVSSKTYTTVGTLTTAANIPQERQVAVLARWTTDQKTKRNHPIYLFSYFHGAYAQASPNADKPDTAQTTAVTAYATAWVTGFSDGTTTHQRGGPRGAAALTGACETYLTHRDFPR